MSNISSEKVMYNVAIVGGGPAGIFAALEITKLKPDWKVILVEKGVRIEERKCLLREGYAKCPTCKKCGLLCRKCSYKIK